jgi:Transcriptional Coactivator p15 (PC4)
MINTTTVPLSNTQEGAQAPSLQNTLTTTETAPRLKTEATIGFVPPAVVSEWQKNSREILRIRLDAYKGQTVIDCRAWYGEPDNLKAGRGGLTLSVKHLPALAAGLVEALDLARRHGLLERLDE